MPRYVALLRGVSPMNCKMPVLQRCLEDAGFTDVKTLLSSGNVAFSTPRATSAAALQKRVEAAMLEGAGYRFATIVRSIAHLQRLLDARPFAQHQLPAGGKCVVTFLREPDAVAEVKLPLTLDDASVLERRGGEVFCVYVPNDKGPAFMRLLEKAFGKAITTRTLDTVARCAQA